MSYPKALHPNGKGYQCCAEVYHKGYWRTSRCQRVASENDAWCAQHSPVAATKRKMASEEAYNKRYNEQLPQIYGNDFYKALLDIENGHNDPRARAKEVLDKFREALK